MGQPQSCCCSPQKSRAGFLGRDKPLVYLVDDDLSVVQALSRLITTAGYRVQPFTCPGEFFDAHDPEEAGCMVVDVVMPGLDGLDLYKKLAAKPHVQPVIFMSGHDNIANVIAAMKMGAIDFLMKPFSEEALFQAIVKAVAKDCDARQRRSGVADLQMRYLSLTRMQKIVLKRVAAGQNSREIAAELDLSEKVIKFHRGNLMRKMGAGNIATLIHLVCRLEEHEGA